MPEKKPQVDRGDRRRGQALVLMSSSLLVLFGLLSLVVDLGYAYYKLEQAQSAADSAALAAVGYALNNGHTCGQNGVVCGSVYSCDSPNLASASTDLQMGCLYANANGFQNGGSQTVSMTADYSVPPGSRSNTATYWVRANVAETIPGLFSFSQSAPGGVAMLFGLTAASSAAASTAAIHVTTSSSCIYVIDTGNTSGAFSVGGSSAVTSSCGIYINSSSSTAMTLNGSAKVNSTVIQLAGGYSKSNNSTLSPTPTVGGTTVPDPLASLPAPSFSGCDYTNWSWSGSTSVTLNPGVYCGGISITGGGTVTFNAGNYILNGGGFNWGGSATLNGRYVMFYITGQNGYTPAPLNAQGNGSINLSAPDSGTYQGVLFYQDRSVSYSTANTFIGNSNSITSGAFYFPTTELSYSGSSTGRYQALVAKKLTMTGNASFLNDPTGTYTPLNSKTTSLIN